MKIVCVGFPAWEGNYIKSTVQLMSALADLGHEILYVEYPFTIVDVFNKQKPGKRVLGLSPRLRTLRSQNGAKVQVLTLPPSLPINRVKHPKVHATLNALNVQIAFAGIKQALQQLNWQPNVMINALNPVLGAPLAAYFPTLKLVYYCYDEVSGANYLKEHGPRLEKQLLQVADAVICSSEPLRKTKSDFNQHTFTIKNGVDLQQFSKLDAFSGSSNKPVIGYLGSVDERINLKLIQLVAGAFPTLIVRLIGRYTTEVEKGLADYDNVELLGPVPIGSIPNEVAKFDVCLIPFLINELTAGIYPMKINEYLACGKPVVSTKFGDLSDFEHIIYVANSEHDFLEKVSVAVSETSFEAVEKRKEFALQNGWESKAKAFEAILMALENS